MAAVTVFEEFKAWGLDPDNIENTKADRLAQAKKARNAVLFKYRSDKAAWKEAWLQANKIQAILDTIPVTWGLTWDDADEEVKVNVPFSKMELLIWLYGYEAVADTEKRNKIVEEELDKILEFPKMIRSEIQANPFNHDLWKQAERIQYYMPKLGHFGEANGVDPDHDYLRAFDGMLNGLRWDKTQKKVVEFDPTPSGAATQNDEDITMDEEEKKPAATKNDDIDDVEMEDASKPPPSPPAAAIPPVAAVVSTPRQDAPTPASG